MELEEWIGGRIIENSDKRGSDNRGSTVLAHKDLMKYEATIGFLAIFYKQKIQQTSLLYIGKCDSFN